MNNKHIPVLLPEVLSFVPKHAKAAFDGTLGGGGHTAALLRQELAVTSSDLDNTAIENFQRFLTDSREARWTGLNLGFDEALKLQEDASLDFILADLGFSSNQLESGNRGFSYQATEEILDLRYDVLEGLPCWRMIQKTRSDELGKIIFRYSGETFAPRIAREIDILKKDQEKQFTVGDIVTAVDKSIPEKFKNKRNAILSRVWQALRIWTNKEFDHLQKFLEVLPYKLNKGGRAAIICFHSLEDKLVTSKFRILSRPHVIDEYGNTKQYFKILTKQPVIPQEGEINANPRSRSALLRVIEKL